MRTPTSTRTDVPRAAAAGPAPAAARTRPAATDAEPRPPATVRAHHAASSAPAEPNAAAPAPPPPQQSVPPATARIVAERTESGATILRDLRPATPWAPRPLPSNRGAAGGHAVVALVQTAATLLSGDDCAIELELGPGAALTVIETGATVAHHVRGGPPARLRVGITLGAGARLEWLARPLVLAAGCDLRRTTTVELAAGARALLRETVVLGRSGEQPGRLSATLRARHDGRPLLHEHLDTAAPKLLGSPLATAAPTLLRSPVVAADAATLDTVLLLGARGADLPGSTQLAGPGTLWRALHPRGADPDGPALTVARAWRS